MKILNIFSTKANIGAHPARRNLAEEQFKKKKNKF